jgi:hypothetical protein
MSTNLHPDTPAGSGIRRRASWSEALGPAGGSLEYELHVALEDNARKRDLLDNAVTERMTWERAFTAAERERRRLELRVIELEGRRDAA